MQGASVPRIVPRVVVEILPHQHAELLTIMRDEAIKALIEECKRSKSDGLVRAPLLCLVFKVPAPECHISDFRQYLGAIACSLTASVCNFFCLRHRDRYDTT